MKKPPLRILICDDERSILRVAELALQVRGHEVDTAVSAAGAIEHFERRRKAREIYDLVLLDIEMPLESGFVAGGHMRGRGYSGRMAFMTAHQPELENFAHLNAEYWNKPFALGELAALVENLPLDCPPPKEAVK